MVVQRPLSPLIERRIAGPPVRNEQNLLLFGSYYSLYVRLSIQFRFSVTQDVARLVRPAKQRANLAILTTVWAPQYQSHLSGFPSRPGHSVAGH